MCYLVIGDVPHTIIGCSYTPVCDGIWPSPIGAPRVNPHTSPPWYLKDVDSIRTVGAIGVCRMFVVPRERVRSIWPRAVTNRIVVSNTGKNNVTVRSIHRQYPSG